MTGRRAWDPKAGPWVAYVERPHPNSHNGVRTMRSYPFPHGDPDMWAGMSWTTTATDAIRYDTRAEALAVIAGPRRRGWRRVAHRIG